MNFWNTKDGCETEVLISQKRDTKDHDLEIDYIDGAQEIPPAPPGENRSGWADGRSNEEITDVGDATFEGIRQEWIDLYDAMTERGEMPKRLYSGRRVGEGE